MHQICIMLKLSTQVLSTLSVTGCGVFVLGRGQAEREEKQRMRQEMGLPTDDENAALGSFDNGDPYTTNLYIGAEQWVGHRPHAVMF